MSSTGRRSWLIHCKSTSAGRKRWHSLAAVFVPRSSSAAFRQVLLGSSFGPTRPEHKEPTRSESNGNWMAGSNPWSIGSQRVSMTVSEGGKQHGPGREKVLHHWKHL